MLTPYKMAIKNLGCNKSQPVLKIGPSSSLLTLLLTLAYFVYRIHGINNINPQDESSSSALVAWMYFFGRVGSFPAKTAQQSLPDPRSRRWPTGALPPLCGRSRASHRHLHRLLW